MKNGTGDIKKALQLEGNYCYYYYLCYLVDAFVLFSMICPSKCVRPYVLGTRMLES